MRPALTREEWARELQRQAKPEFPGDGIRGGAVFETQSGEHAIAALCLHGQPFGFTRHDVSLVRDAADDIDSDGPSGDEHLDRACDIQSGMLRDLADRIEALLPPED